MSISLNIVSSKANNDIRVQVLLQERKTVLNIFNDPFFVSASDWWLNTFSLRRSRMLLMSKVTSVVLSGGNYYSLRYHGNVGRLTVVAQQILKENRANMKKFTKTSDTREPQYIRQHSQNSKK